MNKTKNATKAVALVLIVAAAFIVSAYGVSYVLQMSAPQQATWQSGVVQVPVAISLNATTLSDLEHLELTALTGPNGNGLLCHFYDGTTLLGTATIVSETAKIVIAAPAVLGVHDYKAGP